MTVHRIGPAPEEAAPHRTDLGRVLVTIDDLKALMEFLTRDCERRASDLKVEFDGGDFSEPEDLRTLSDVEMRSLRLKSSKVEVVLNPSAAFAVGDRQEAEDVYRLWARTRQSRLRPPSIKYVDRPGYPFFFIGTQIVMLSILIIISNLILDEPSLFSQLDLMYMSFVVIVLIVFFSWRQYRKMASSYAVIVPLSLSEHRQSQSSQMYPRRSWIVAIVAAIIAVAAVGVAIWAVLSR